MRRVKIVLEKPLTKAYLLFPCSALPIVNNFNMYMQQQSPILHVLYKELDGLIRKFLLRFMNSEYVCAAEHVSQVCSDNSEEYLPLHKVFIGYNTLSYLEEEDGLSSEDVRKFRETIQAWWIAAAKGAVKRLPMSHKLLSNLKWLQPGLQQYSMAGQVLAAAECVPQVVQVGNKHSLQEEFIDFCMLPLPPKVAAITEVDKYWHAISQIKDCLETEYRYSTLAKLAKAILVIHHGNADTEHICSHIGLNKTKHRKKTRNFYIKFTFNRAIQCSSKML